MLPISGKRIELLLLGLFASLLSCLGLPQRVGAQIVPDGTTKTEVTGNAIAPTGSGTVFGGNLFHSFDQFNVPITGVTFSTGTSTVNGSAINNIINRVTGSNPSQILGVIESRTHFPNANLYLLNPNGVIFGANARLDIGGSFFATTGTGLNFNNGQSFLVDRNSLSFPSGDVNGIRFGVENPAGIINQGHLQVDQGKTISLTGGTVINTGTLTANAGNVSLSSANGNSLVELRSPNAVLGLSIKANAIPNEWNGSLASIPRLAEHLTGSVPEADRVIVKPDGSMWLVGREQANQGIAVEQGLTIASGKIDTSNQNGTGGNVGIYGSKVALVNANVNANGRTGGGTILVGGDYKGEGTVPNAQVTFVSRNSTISSNGLVNGNGGKVIFWADNTTRFFGTVSSRGGSLGGDGGFIEISGKRTLVFDGNVYATAPFGKKGTVLFDPQVIEIISSNSQPDDNQLDDNVPSGQPQGLIAAADTPSVMQISTTKLITTSEFADIFLETSPTGSVTFALNPSFPLEVYYDSSITVTTGTISGTISGDSFSVQGSGSINLLAQNTINFSGGGTITAESGSINMSAPNGINSNVRLRTTDGGSVNLTSGGNIVSGAIDTSPIPDTLRGIGGNVSIFTIANVRIISTITSGDCVGSSICTAGALGNGFIDITHGGFYPFIIGDASINGTAGFITTGESSLPVGTVISNVPAGTFRLGLISITALGFSNNSFLPPPEQNPLVILDPPPFTPLVTAEIYKNEADQAFQSGNLERAFDALEKMYASEFEGYVEDKLSIEIKPLSKLQEELEQASKKTGSVTFAVYPVIFKNRLEILVIPPKGVGMPFSRTVNGVSADKILPIVQEFISNLRDPLSNDHLEQGQQLHKWIMESIAPVIDKMAIDAKVLGGLPKQGKVTDPFPADPTLVFVMDGSLRTMPVAALHDGRQFLIEKYAVATVPSLRLTRLEERDRKNTRVIAMGLSEEMQGFAPLPAVKVEISNIVSLLQQGRAVLNEGFTVNNLQALRQQDRPSIIHLATHAQFLSDTASGAFIQMWNERLPISRIPKLRFNDPLVEMLTLSACQTALGQNLGIAGLAAQSGARSVLASLWTVSDAGTAPLMIKFYEDFKDAPSKALSLQEAQQALIRGNVRLVNGQILGTKRGVVPLGRDTLNADLKHPFFWAPFILVGNWL